MKYHLLHGLVAGVLASTASLVYSLMYQEALWSDFSSVVSTVHIILASIIGTLIASLGYFILKQIIKKKIDTLFNIVLTALSCTSFVIPLTAELPLNVEFPELFAGFVIPMHLFPALGWMAVKPMFENKLRNNSILS